MHFVHMFSSWLASNTFPPLLLYVFCELCMHGYSQANRTHDLKWAKPHHTFATFQLWRTFIRQICTGRCVQTGCSQTRASLVWHKYTRPSFWTRMCESETLLFSSLAQCWCRVVGAGECHVRPAVHPPELHWPHLHIPALALLQTARSHHWYIAVTNKATSD